MPPVHAVSEVIHSVERAVVQFYNAGAFSGPCPFDDVRESGCIADTQPLRPFIIHVLRVYCERRIQEVIVTHRIQTQTQPRTARFLFESPIIASQVCRHLQALIDRYASAPSNGSETGTIADKPPRPVMAYFPKA